VMRTIQLTVVAAVAALAFASSALALGGTVYARISADWATPGAVNVTVLSNHSFNGGTVNVSCGTAVNTTKPLDSWTFDQIAHQNVDGPTPFDISAAGSGVNCTITVMDGHKQLAQQSFVST